MSNCDSCSSKGKCEGTCNKLNEKYGNIKNVIGIISGKGGVGKSTVTGIIASELNRKGFKVGVLDADITGPSMPRFFGVNDKRAEIVPINEKDEFKFMPIVTEKGIKIISLNLLMDDEEQPVIWRGPVITGALTQMYTDTAWGEIDYLLVDMPPGTGDVALTIMQSIPLMGLVVVSTPQDMVSMIVKKVINMADKMDIKVFGIVENMSYVKCPKCGEKINILSSKDAAFHAEHLGKPLIYEMPIDIDLVKSLENGDTENYIYESKNYADLGDNFLELIK